VDQNDRIIDFSDMILVTGANGFIGPRVVKTLLDYGFVNLKCCVRPSSNLAALKKVISSYKTSNVQICRGNLSSQVDCEKLTEGVQIVYHLAAAMRDTNFESSYMNNVVTTENLLNGVAKNGTIRRFVDVSSLRVYSNMKLRSGALLDETCRVESDLFDRGDAYCSAKVKQDDLVTRFCTINKLSYVIVRPGIVYGPGNREIHRMVGRRIRIGTFELFLHLGGANKLPLSYVDNCADAIVLAGISKSADREVFNVVDDNLPTSTYFLKLYKQNVRRFSSIYLPYPIIYAVCYFGEKYYKLFEKKSPPTLNRRKCAAAWKGNDYSNAKLKKLLGWEPKVSFDEALKRYFDYQTADSI